MTADQAIKLATDEAKKRNYDTRQSDIEVLKVKKGMERGPIRVVTLVRLFPKDLAPVLMKNEFWVVLFYPKGELEKPGTSGGDFIALIDLRTGKIIKSLAGKPPMPAPSQNPLLKTRPDAGSHP